MNHKYKLVRRCRLKKGLIETMHGVVRFDMKPRTHPKAIDDRIAYVDVFEQDKTKPSIFYSRAYLVNT